MPCEILVTTNYKNNVNPNPDRDREGVWKKGYPVNVQDGGHGWGAKEGPPRFVIVRVTDAVKDDLLPYITPWVPELEFEVINYDSALDGYRIEARVKAELVGTGDQLQVDKDKIKRWLDEWTATVHSFGPNWVRFDVGIYNAAISEGFWNKTKGYNNVAFNEDSYNETTGEHVITASIVFFPGSRDVASIERKIERKFSQLGVTLLGSTPESVTWSIDSQDVFSRAKSQIARYYARTHKYCRRLYYFDSDDVDFALTQPGGLMEVTFQQLKNNIRRRADD